MARTSAVRLSAFCEKLVHPLLTIKNKLDTALLAIIAGTLLVLVGMTSRPPAPMPVQAYYFTWDAATVTRKDSAGDTWHTNVRFCTTHTSGPDTEGIAVRVYSPEAVMTWLAGDGWTFAWTDGKTFLMQRQGEPEQWRYGSFKVVSEKD